jgi:hypothetical protein
MITEEDVIVARNQVDMPYAYVVYDHARAGNVETIRHWLRARDIELAGRYSEWEYYNSDHAFLAGKKAAEQVEDALTRKARRRRPRAKSSLICSRPRWFRPRRCPRRRARRARRDGGQRTWNSGAVSSVR